MELEAIEYRNLTPEEVLTYLRLIPDQSPDIIAKREIQLDTPLSRWAKWWDCPQFPMSADFARWLFGSEISDEDWQGAVEPRNDRTVRDVCEVIARSIRVPIVPTVSVFGTTCRKAGAFLLIKKLMSDAGADVSKLAPSTPLSKFSKRGLPAIRNEIGLLKPEFWKQLNACDWRPVWLALAMATLPFPFAFIDSSWLCNMALMLPVWWIISICFFKLLEELRILKPFEKVRFLRLTTFRDLSVAIAAVAETREQGWRYLSLKQ